ncbi:hypothetical protein [Pseudoalteromonas luteoviolacea]|uniref:Uncharacterized protein n=1 Tax=Pseudoalteromonas luteoviolacea S4054 TaxID=1129367 RepID=A0A0F6ABC1_9GAMM|nr:hypothetical protein [Pseudoalteromonas luteoviolacea]AOT09434.1 hypothetical protein S4054249_16960 [Pseudoalteromonas luteoviolacea]AOT14346.1 hypothetical protein S40542_16930 [Pseudoalteromonas luteoviolacea]AOT19262.1 hypothetical protein S4054_16935 [Pseudoalteromonas luteoviolacea]KKE83146.1 hypothetical protein N479_15885 [Pseudoalteromonas luteoviolacea S4054]KZN73537.1 hypothetical protein N481_12550 [Pseudoalteromonas luteoviolacea S4047-1]
MLLHKSALMPITEFAPTKGSKSKESESQAFAKEMRHSADSELSQSFKQKDLSVSRLNNSFLAKARQSMMFNRLGVNEAKVKEIESKMQELLARLESGEIDQKEFEKQMSALQEMLAKEYRRGGDEEDEGVKVEHP